MISLSDNGVSGFAIIDREACMGSGNCLYWAPGVFDLDETGVAIVAGDLRASEESVRRGAMNCPTGAVRAEQFYG